MRKHCFIKLMHYWQLYIQHNIYHSRPCLSMICRQKPLPGCVCFSVKLAQALTIIHQIILIFSCHDLEEASYFLLVRGGNTKKPLPSRISRSPPHTNWYHLGTPWIFHNLYTMTRNIVWMISFTQWKSELFWPILSFQWKI